MTRARTAVAAAVLLLALLGWPVYDLDGVWRLRF
jgi:hypothetical protein